MNSSNIESKLQIYNEILTEAALSDFNRFSTKLVSFLA